jgi:uncharacterized membrane protein
MHLLTVATEPSASWIEDAALAMEWLAIVVIVVGIVFGGVRFAIALLRRSNAAANYNAFKAFMGRTLLLGLEILVAADVVRTVALEPTLQNVGTLGVLVVIRTFLSWSVSVEIEGRWPWQGAQAEREKEGPVEQSAAPGHDARGEEVRTP